MHNLFAPRVESGSRATKRDRTAAKDSCIVRFTNCRVLRDSQIVEGEDLWVRDGTIADPQALFFSGHVANEIVDCLGRILAPGYIDLQLNGAFGVDFCAPSPTLAEGVSNVARQLLAYGVTAFLPTVITSSPASYRGILPALVPTRGTAATGASVLGVHLEGPFISRSKPGCHPPEHIKTPDGKPDALRRACGDHIAHVRLVTLAPELPNATELIAELVENGIVVSAGHSAASSSQIESAHTSGVSMCTHLFNAMPAFHPREPGIVGILGSTTRRPFYFGLIADGVHVHFASAKIAAMARPESVVLVSDAIVAMGLPEGKYQLGDAGSIEIVGGDRAYRTGTSTLAGAVVPLDECVRRFRRECGCSIVQAVEAASLHPAQALGLEATKGSIRIGADADLLLLDDELNVQRVFIGGKLAWPPVEPSQMAAPWPVCENKV